MDKKLEKLQWHPAFCSATELELREDKDNLEFLREYPLSKQPLKIDLMVIKKKPGIVIKNEIGRLFKIHNIIEYKNPYDNLNIDDYYKTLSYLCLYKSLGKYVNEIPYNELSLTLVYDSFPINLINTLKECGLSIELKYKGIYYIKGNPSVPYQQIIIISELGKPHFLLKSLSKVFTVNDGIELAKFSETVKSKDDNENLDALFQVSVIANSNVFNELKKENNTMYEVLKDLFKEEIAAEILAAEKAAEQKTETRVRAETEAKMKALEEEIAELKKKIVS